MEQFSSRLKTISKDAFVFLMTKRVQVYQDMFTSKEYKIETTMWYFLLILIYAPSNEWMHCSACEL